MDRLIFIQYSISSKDYSLDIMNNVFPMSLIRYIIRLEFTFKRNHIKHQIILIIEIRLKTLQADIS